MTILFNYMIDVPGGGEALASIIERDTSFVNKSGKPLAVQNYSPFFHPGGYRISSFCCESTLRLGKITKELEFIVKRHSADAVVNVCFISNQPKLVSACSPS